MTNQSFATVFHAFYVIVFPGTTALAAKTQQMGKLVTRFLANFCIASLSHCMQILPVLKQASTEAETAAE